MVRCLLSGLLVLLVVGGSLVNSPATTTAQSSTATTESATHVWTPPWLKPCPSSMRSVSTPPPDGEYQGICVIRFGPRGIIIFYDLYLTPEGFRGIYRGF